MLPTGFYFMNLTAAMRIYYKQRLGKRLPKRLQQGQEDT